MRLRFPIQMRLPVSERLVLRGGRWARTPLAVRFGVLERPGHRPILIDAGWATPRPGDSLAFRTYDRVMPARPVDGAENPVSVAPEKVLVSHLHADHVGALRDLDPSVQIHADRTAWARARQGGWAMLRHAVFPELLPDRPVIDLATGPAVPLPHGLGTGHDVLGDGSVLSVPLPGHADGHTGFVFPAFERPVLYAADAQWVLPALAPAMAPHGPMARVYSDPAAVPETIARVRAFAEAGGIVVLNHDPAPIGPFSA